MIYSGWTEMRVTRDMTRGASDFDIQVTEKRIGSALEPFQIRGGDAVVVKLGGSLALTGFVDRSISSVDDNTHEVRISGRSKTQDLVDCTPKLRGTEFRGSTLSAICRLIAAQFAIEVVTQVPDGRPFTTQAKELTDKAWDTIEKLCRMRSCLPTDDEAGRLVLTRAGQGRASGALVLGENVLEAKAKQDDSKRFSEYLVITQTPPLATMAGPAQEPFATPGTGANVRILGQARDPDIRRNRPRYIKAEGAGDAAFARERAVWAATTARAKALGATLTVKGWRQADGRLWRVNELVKVTAPWLRIDRDLLITRVEYTLSKNGRRTELELTPQEALNPEPLRTPVPARGRWDDVIRNPVS